MMQNLAEGIVVLSLDGRKEHNNDDDLCVINTIRGKVMVGLLGDDVAPDIPRGERAEGFWKRLFYS